MHLKNDKIFIGDIMRGQKGGLKDRFISLRILKAKIKKEKCDMDFSEFEKLLDFGESKKIKVYLEMKPLDNNINSEIIVLNKTNIMRDKIGLVYEQKKGENQNIDFSMFDKLMDEFKNEEIPKVKIVKKLPKDERVKFLKTELDYYQNKIDNEYNLIDLEKYENELFRIKNKIDELKGKYSFAFLDYKFNTININEIIDELNNCTKELEDLEKGNNGSITKKELINKIDVKINLNIEKQKQFLLELKKEIEKINGSIQSKIYLCMVKRMMFNLYRLLIGLYKIDATKKNYLKLNTGVFLVINAIIGMEKALRMDFTTDGYYSYKDYVTDHMNIKDVTIITYNFMNKSSNMISKLQKLMKENFSNYKEYSHDYEEVYFKLSKFQEIIIYQSKQCEYLIDKMNNREKMVLKK